MMPTVTIGITFSETRFAFYPRWILGNDLHIRILLLSPRLHNISSLQECDAIVVTGGIDIHPSFYNSSRLAYPFAPANGWMIERDLFEKEICNQAVSRKIPILAICRGLQLMNVCLGGTLLADIEESGKNNHRRTEEGDPQHPITIHPNCLLASITNQSTAIVNTAHHQAIDQVAAGLMISALSPDGIIEAVEWKDPNQQGPLLAVQWHPERMNLHTVDPVANAIRAWLLSEARKFVQRRLSNNM